MIISFFFFSSLMITVSVLTIDFLYLEGFMFGSVTGYGVLRTHEYSTLKLDFHLYRESVLKSPPSRFRFVIILYVRWRTPRDRTDERDVSGTYE